MDEDNQIRMKQVSLLIQITGLFFIWYGDFNITPDGMYASGWPQFLKGEILTPTNATTTLRETAGRMIDYILISSRIVGMVKSLLLDLMAPSTPHFMLNLVLYGAPRTISEPTFCYVTPLPIVDFKREWAALNIEAQNDAVAESFAIAKSRLQWQKEKTGVAILGAPLRSIYQDEK